MSPRIKHLELDRNALLNFGINPQNPSFDAIANPYSPSEASSSPRQIVFIDAPLTDWQTINADIDSHIEVILLDAGQDGLQQIADALNPLNNLRAICSHGREGALQLGATTLNSDNLA